MTVLVGGAQRQVDGVLDTAAIFQDQVGMFEVIQAKVTTSSKISTVQPQQWLLQQEVERDGEIFYHAQMQSSAKIENVVWLQGKEIRSIDFRPKADAPQGFKPLKIRWKKERIVDFHLAFSNPPQILPQIRLKYGTATLTASAAT